MEFNKLPAIKTLYFNQGMAPGTTIIDLFTSVTDEDQPPPDNYEYSINPYQIDGVRATLCILMAFSCLTKNNVLAFYFNILSLRKYIC